jgi:hypothetical protein
MLYVRGDLSYKRIRGGEKGGPTVRGSLMKKILLVMVAVLAMAAMTVQSASTPTGKIKVPAGLMLELKINGKPVLVPSGRECPMPAGTYTPATLTAQAVGNGTKEVWSIKSTGPFGKLQSIEIAEGATSTIDAGPPLTLRALVGKPVNTAKGKEVSIGLAIIGKAGEQYAANTMRKGMTVAPKPQFQILDDKGNVLTQGGFEYG